MTLEPNETQLIGQWIEDQGQLRKDATCERIEWLTSQYLRKVALSPQWGAWEILFQDPSDMRYWEQTYPHGGMHGGGPPALKQISNSEAESKYPGI